MTECSVISTPLLFLLLRTSIRTELMCNAQRSVLQRERSEAVTLPKMQAIGEADVQGMYVVKRVEDDSVVPAAVQYVPT